ncbi:solute carrier family 23 member 1 [Patella vulgata]|uniref:solute carrier family 23 member 1 n=1 Tax=Patella vulgata TaxID=6465 RepID=UPI0024A8DDD4|nr:solute carrier family 23 member 1 [Patella vulgata]
MSFSGGISEDDPQTIQKASECEPLNPEKPDDVIIEEVKDRPLIYYINETPPFYLTILFAFQQALLPISASLSVSLTVAEVVCARDDAEIKSQLLSTAFMMSGISTVLMCTVGVRLPIFQGPSGSYIVPLVGLMTMKEWSCPSREELVSLYSNSSTNMTEINGRLPVPREFIIGQIEKLQGSLMAADVIHLLIGLTGLVGVVARYVGPITIVPALLLAVLYIHKVVVKFAETFWPSALSTTVSGIILSLYLRGKRTPIPMWTKGRGFHILWYPLHQVFSILISVIFGWILSAIFTSTGILSSDPSSVQFYARTDARNDIITTNPWFYFPYPGQFGGFRFDTAAFVGSIVATIMSVVDSICDYNACARVCHAPFPPAHALNRGIFWEGLMSFFAGMTGAGHATSSYGGNIGAIGITKVASRRVFQLLGAIYILFAILGKLNAAFITIPYSVLGGTMILYFGIFLGIVLSQLQFIDMNSSRNLAIIGISILVGFMVPYWIVKHPDGIKTGIVELDTVLTMCLANGIFIAGAVACFLDNTVKGTKQSRGLEAQLGRTGTHQDDQNIEYEEGMGLYDVPKIPQFVKISRFAKYCPIMPKYKGLQTDAKEVKIQADEDKKTS